jgi:glucose-6-phosphate 1-dehydrogenase
VYRIDHYLGKETVQNITVFRFANECITPLLNSRYVDHIQITVAERIGIEGRGGYYESTGALRDMVQNHLLQVMSLVCMEPPASLDAEAVRDEKVRLFRAVRRIEPGDVAAVSTRGQYGSGRLLGEQVAGYREEKGVAPDSTTETFVALKLHIDNPRWEGAPVYLRTGKRLAKRASEIAIRLKNVPAPLFGEGDGIHPNVISINIQPDEGVALLFEAKTPGLDYRIQPVRMEFKYGTGFGASVPEAYERLILDALSGDQSLYTRADGLDATWEICDPLLRAWQSGEPPLFTYRPGIWGPREADDLILRDGRKWRML